MLKACWPSPRKAFRDNYLAAIGVMVFLAISSASSAQIFQYPNPGTYGLGGHRAASDSTLYFPTGCGAPTDSTFLRSYGFTGFGQKLKMAAKYYDSCGHHEYVWDPSLRTWHRVDSSGGGGGGFTIADTGYTRLLASPFLVQKTIDSMKIVNDGRYSPGGSNTQIQFNNSGSFGGDASLTWNNGTKVLSTDTLHSKQITVDVDPVHTKWVLQMRPKTRPNSSNGFLSFEFDSTNNYDGVTDNVMGWGNNLIGDGVRYNDTLPGFGFFVESWFDVPGGRQMEHEMDMVTKTGGNHRLLQLDMNADNGGAIWMYEGDSWQFNSPDGSPYFQFDTLGNFNYTRSLPHIVFGDPDPDHGQLQINMGGSGEVTIDNYSTGADNILDFRNNIYATPSKLTENVINANMGANSNIYGFNVFNSSSTGYVGSLNTSVSADGGTAAYLSNTSGAAGAFSVLALQSAGDASNANSAPFIQFRRVDMPLTDVVMGYNPLTHAFEIHQNSSQFMVDSPRFSILESKQIKFDTSYGSGTFDATPVKILGVTADGSVVTSDPSAGGSPPFDANTAIVKDHSDNTKLLKLDVSAIATGTTRTWNYPNYNGTHAALDHDQTFSATTNTFSNHVNIDPSTGELNAAGAVFQGLMIWDSTTVTSSTLGTGAGTSASLGSGHGCGNIVGKIDVVTGSSPSTSATVLTITVSCNYGDGITPVILSPANAAAAALSGNSNVWADAGNSTINIHSGSTALAASTEYKWNYIIMKHF